MKQTTKTTISLFAAVVFVLALLLGGMNLMAFERFEAEQLKADTLLAETAWYAALVDSIKAELPADVEGATGHVQYLMLRTDDNSVDTSDILTPFFGYQYMEELPLGLHRIHSIPFSGIELHAALLEWSQGLRSEAPQLTLLDSGPVSPVLVLVHEDPLFDLSDDELARHYFQLLGNFLGDFVVEVMGLS